MSTAATHMVPAATALQIAISNLEAATEQAERSIQHVTNTFAWVRTTFLRRPSVQVVTSVAIDTRTRSAVVSYA